ncbi:spermidine synthase [Limnohabitans sp. INBF002]|uniref:spermidine synthase n=1 Tax=Limnohabitans sp. INBF002 TaxID=2986280 RepID=UPI002377C975|nr:hypothetical protein LINBF2_15360 [Limnohabitans sp. INBF002]
MVLTPIELIFGLVGCILAMLIGAWMAKKQARAFSHQSHANADQTVQQNGDLPVVTFADYGDMRFLHLGTPAVQGSMKVSKPFEIHLEYQQRMMGWLLLTDLDQVSHKHAMQLGLGAASLTKFCYQHLKMRTIAIELNPQVITTCRQWFNLPKDNDKLQVVLGDAAEIAGDDQWRGKIDALQVDLYDQDAARPVIDSEDFYRDCRSLLTHEGCMAVNLFGQASNYDESLKKITTAFGKDAVWAFKPTPAGNAIVLALRTPRVFDTNTLQAQAQTIQTRWPLPATKWLKTLAPISKTMTLDRASLS